MRNLLIGFLALGLVACDGKNDWEPEDTSTDGLTDTTTDGTTDITTDTVTDTVTDGTADTVTDGTTDTVTDGTSDTVTEEITGECGDSTVDTGEDCDDGNDVEGDGCENDCTYTCEVDEDCDDDLLCNGAETCDSDHICAAGTAAVDGTECLTDTSADGTCQTGLCVLIECGNDILEPDEDCEEGGIDTATCDADCSDVECGDGYTNEAAGEDCDDGNTVDTDACPNSCLLGCGGTLYSFNRDAGGETAPTTFNESSKADASLLGAIGLTGVGQVAAASFDPVTGNLYVTHGGGGCCPVSGYAGCLLTTDVATGVTTVVGCDPVFFDNDNLPGLAVDSTGAIYGMLLACNAGPMDCGLYLVSVHKTTGAITLIGLTNGEDWPQGNGMAFGPGDVLYYSNSSDGFGTVDLTTGVFTSIGESFVGFPGSESFVTDMAYDAVADVMYAAVAEPGGDATSTALATVDLATGTFTYLGSFPARTASIAVACPTS